VRATSLRDLLLYLRAREDAEARDDARTLAVVNHVRAALGAEALPSLWREAPAPRRSSRAEAHATLARMKKRFAHLLTDARA
jgi:hypothetical protein